MAASSPGADDVTGAQTEAGDARTQRGPVRRSDLPLPFRLVDIACSAVLVVLVAGMLIVVGWNVVGRFVLDHSLTWSDEAARYMFIWMIFLGALVAHLRQEHISVEYFVARAPRPVRLAAAITRELVILVVLGIMLWGSTHVISTTFGRSALLGVPFNVVNYSVPVAAALMAVMSMYRLIRLLTGRDE
ncbi:TRAP transporter small permease [Actinobacteria bacterium YIM 96077]|uniref:TRAP transporter small permease n=1 Tax=Phytoactinopolyspora halophila TaxID=1981511 RepID=A0A329QJL6_9ACTN|nr:TRAP transporter small permease [Phytoactinopolyspora halophila]AYY12597.1 TRAP transporter small permease [Actinobacteria bacterium YIM 96077]RAW12500.1 TRAP transporter small permease [Phytoactinopolyspora halophila]